MHLSESEGFITDIRDKKVANSDGLKSVEVGLGRQPNCKVPLQAQETEFSLQNPHLKC